MKLEEVTAEALDLTQQFIADVKAMIDPPEGSDRPALAEMTLTQKQIVSGLLAKLMRAATGMIKEARALSKDAKEVAKHMTYDDQRSLIVDFIQIMPEHHKQQLREQLGW
jgi:hypothetical protein